MTAPVVLFAYERVEHVRRTIESLQKNAEALTTDLIIFSDGPKTEENESSVEAVRAYLRNIAGFRSIQIYQKDQNHGLAKSVIEGVTCTLEKYDSVIILEDDLVVSPYFLAYMNEALERYRTDERVISIHGYVYPVARSLPETFFLRGADCWGWATWRRGWRLFNPDGHFLLNELKRRKLSKLFDFNGATGYTAMLRDQVEGLNDSWAIRWHASAFLANKLTLYPGRSLVHNIGNDGSGTHCGESSMLDVTLAKTPVEFEAIQVEESYVARDIIKGFFRSQRAPIKYRIFIKIKCLLRFLLPYINDFLPPVLLKCLRRMFQPRHEALFVGPFQSWNQASRLSTGYVSQDILEKVLAATLKVKNGEAVYERDSVLFNEIEYSWPVASGLMWAAARNNGQLSVLDFGGSLGSSYFQNRKLFEGLKELRWSVIEQEHFVNAGKSYISNEHLCFYSSIEECLFQENPNVILLSSTLQYLKDPHSMLDELLNVGADIFIFDLTITNKSSKDMPYVQNVPENIYKASYPVWAISESKLYESLYRRGYKKIASFQTLEFPELSKIGADFQGGLFCKGVVG